MGKTSIAKSTQGEKTSRKPKMPKKEYYRDKKSVGLQEEAALKTLNPSINYPAKIGRLMIHLKRKLITNILSISSFCFYFVAGLFLFELITGFDIVDDSIATIIGFVAVSIYLVLKLQVLLTSKESGQNGG